MLKKKFILIYLLLFIQSSFTSQNNWEKFYNQSFDYLFNYEFDKAVDALNKARKLNLYNPSIYWRLTFVFWFKAEYGKNSKKKLKEMFDEIFSKGVALCDSNSTDPEILFYLGGLYGNRVFFKQAIGQRNKSMLDDTNKSREYLRKIKKTEDFYYEACGYLGVFNYGPILMSGFQKWFVRKTSYKWDEDKGLEQLKKAMKDSRFADDTKFLYKGILVELARKKKYRNKAQEAISLIKSLIKKYPRNSVLKEDLKILEKILKK